jgi:peptidoglycan/xylan/chitin deacetylase (PgdA/CDA1 family)
MNAGSGSAVPLPTSGSAVEIAHGPRDKPAVALTFHGAGDVGLARQILRIVNARGARITVMVVGTWLSDNPGIAAEIVAGGHQLGNHTWSHQDINSMSEGDMRQEVIRCRDLLTQTTGTPGAYFRPSQTPTANALMKRVAGAAGYPISLSYDVDSMDYTDPGATAVRRNMGAAQAGSIVSMHLGHQDTVDALPDILEDLTVRGLAAVTVGELLAG